MRNKIFSFHETYLSNRFELKNGDCKGKNNVGNSYENSEWKF